MLKPPINNFFVVALVLCGGVFAACSSRNESTLRAVEVGNPEDSKPAKPNPNVPLRLVQVELEATALEEISKLELVLASVKLVDTSSAGEGYLSSSPSTQSASKLILVPQTKLTIEFKVPEDKTFNASDLKLSFSFNSDAPGSVWVGSNRYEIDKQVKPLLLDVAPPVQVGDKNAPILISGTISKAQIFEPSLSPAQIPASEPKTSPSTPVYRLK